jgi:hypothetical protein
VSARLRSGAVAPGTAQRTHLGAGVVARMGITYEFDEAQLKR